MAKKDKPNPKYGSPFDPKSPVQWAKLQQTRDQFAEQAAREQEQHRLRGCGDPNCAQCNPETAGATLFSYGGNGNYSYASIDEARRTVYEQLRDYNPSAFVEFGTGTKGPPASYTEAREAVKQWLITAPEQSFDDIVGNEEALIQLRDAIQAPVKYKELYETYGMKMPKGACLSGPPGCGKTMFGRAAASEMKKLYGKDTEFISISGSELQSMYIGQTEGYIKAIFTFAREYKAYRGHPLLVFMDEAEVLLPDRTGRVRRVASYEESQVATFLAEMDGIRESGAFVLLATNRPEVIDQAVLRDGRCDFKVVVKRPTQENIGVILHNIFVKSNVPRGEGVDVKDLVFAALESLYDPHRVILEAHAVKLALKETGIEVVDTQDKHFLLEHIISGAMAASLPTRAKRYAFARDKASGVVTGVTSADVVRAVNDLFEENKRLDHSFALNEFKEEFLAGLNKKEEKKDGYH